MNAREILSRKDIFSGDEASVRREFHRLVAAWHPDVCGDPQAGEVMAHLVALRDHALSGFGARPRSNGLDLTDRDGHVIRTAPISVRKTDFGQVLIGSRTASLLFPAEMADIGERESRAVSAFRFADDAMRSQMGPMLPKHLKDIPLEDGGRLVILPRSHDEVLLSDLLARDGALPDRHAAWLCSGLLNICCWLSWAGLAHGAIGPDTILVDPGTHGVRLAAGWGFTHAIGARPEILPERTLARLPRLAVAGQKLDAATDPELVRLTVMEALGGPSGRDLRARLPAGIAAWLTMPPAAGAIEDYRAWQKALVDGWGPRKFIRYEGRFGY